MKRLLTYLIIVLLAARSLYAQDYRFSQFYNAPLLLNPAFTGDHKSHYRMFLNYKDQWSSISNSFKTVSGSFDMPAFEDVAGINKMGFGLSFLSDKAGSTNYGFNNINLSFAYHTRITRFSKLSGGLVFGYGQSQVNLDDVKWENQHNGNNHDPSLPSGEAVFADQIRYMDAGAGISYSSIDPENDMVYVIGLSATHLNFPNHSFIGQYQNRLKPKFQLHAEIDIGFEYFVLKPKLLVMNQGPSTSFNVGSMARFKLGSQPDSRFTDAYVGSAFEIGMFYHFNESIIFMAQYEFKRNLLIGLSYDIVISDLAAASASGGYEIALRYQGLFDNKRIKIKKDMEPSQQKKEKKKGKRAKTNVRM